MYFRRFCKDILISVWVIYAAEKALPTKASQANGLCERVNILIKSALYTMDHFDHFTAAIFHQSVYNATTHPVTEFSSNLLHFG